MPSESKTEITVVYLATDTMELAKIHAAIGKLVIDLCFYWEHCGP